MGMKWSATMLSLYSLVAVVAVTILSF